MDRRERRHAAAERFASLAAVGHGWLRRGTDPRAPPHWVIGILLVAVPSQALAVWRVHAGLPAGTRPALRDSLIFEYIGWYLARGGRLYVDVWELKPPLPYEVTGLIALLAGGDPGVAHGLNVALTTGAAVGVALAAGWLVFDLTGDATAAFAAGVALYVFPAFHWRAAFGFKVKYFVALFALLALLLARRDRPLAAGGLAGAATGFWQLAVVVPALVLGLAYDRGGRPAVARVAAGGAGVLVIALLPVVYWGAVEAMVTEVVLVPLLVGSGSEAGFGGPLAVSLLGASFPVVLLGGVGVALGAWRRPRETWWLAAGTGWFVLQVLVIDLDSAPDLFPLLAFLAVGVGLLLGDEPGRQRAAAVLLALLAVSSVATMGGFWLGSGPVFHPDPVVYEPDRELTVPYTPAERAHLYWHPAEPATCRVFFGPTQYRLVRLTGSFPWPETCGDAGPVLDALAARWFG